MTHKKIFFYLVVLLTALNHCPGQDLSDIQLIKAAFNNEINKKINLGEQIIYSDKVSGTENFKNKILKSKVFKDMYHGNRTVTLTGDERKFIIDQLDANKNFCWPENLFSNSRRVKSENLLSYAIKEDVYVFSKPIYIRNRTLALMGFSRTRRGGSENEQAFYRFENGKWFEFVSFSGSVE